MWQLSERMYIWNEFIMIVVQLLLPMSCKGIKDEEDESMDRSAMEDIGNWSSNCSSNCRMYRIVSKTISIGDELLFCFNVGRIDFSFFNSILVIFTFFADDEVRVIAACLLKYTCRMNVDDDDDSWYIYIWV